MKSIFVSLLLAVLVEVSKSWSTKMVPEKSQEIGKIRDHGFSYSSGKLGFVVCP